MKKTIIIFLILNISFSCSNHNANKIDFVKNYENTILNVDTPKGNNKKFQINFNYKLKLENELKLKSLENGTLYDEIRFWVEPFNIDTVFLFILKKTETNWLASYYLAKRNENKINNLLKNVNKISFSKPQRDNWYTFLNKLKSLEILSIPDQSELKNYPNDVDGECTYTIEIATKNEYKIFSYNDIEYLKMQYKEAENFSKIIKFIKENFNGVFYSF